MDLNLRGRTAVVTGATRGIGRAVAFGLASEGCDLHIVARTRDLLDKLARELIERFGICVEAHTYDIANADIALEMVSKIGAVDILVNNAGAIPRGSLNEVDEERWRQGWELKVFGYIRLCRLFYPLMCARGTGVIINVIGVSGQRADANYIATVTANAGLMMFSESLGGESVRYGVRVVGVNPGIVATDRFMRNIRQRATKKYGDESRWTEILSDLPIGRPAKPEEISDGIIFLASERASYISGVTITIDGGLKSRPPTGI
jgi:NAD(P)-dependent dehydrogenase (short-subunit alcohol dehydrogenase family)